MKNGKGIKVIIVLVVVIALVVIGGLKIKNVYDGFMDEYKGTESASGTDVTIEIPEGASSKKVAAILHDAGLIKYEYAFVLRVKESEYRGRIIYTEHRNEYTRDDRRTLLCRTCQGSC